MFSSLTFILWLAWLAGPAVIAVIRQRAVSAERQQRAERRQLREARPRPRMVRQPASSGYRDQRVAAGNICPAPEPEVSLDPAVTI